DMVEEMRMHDTFLGILKDRKEKDKVRFSNYENEIFTKYPNLKKNEVGLIFDYVDGVYKMVNDQEVSNIILRELSEDMLWNFRTKKHISDKVACLLSIIPDLVITEDKGEIMNVKNGLLNIYTKVLMEHTPDFVSLIQSPVSYDPEALCPVWESCVEAWMDGDEAEAKKEMLKQFSGYTLTSSMNYDRALFLVGDGGNGKSTFVDTIAMVIGDSSTSHIDLEDLYGQFGMYALVGKRLNIIEEVHGNYYQSNKLKKLISGEPVTINVKYKDAFFFKPQAKFIFAVNIMPRVDDTSTAMERRICAIQFKNNFRQYPNTALRNSGGLLARELSGILNWMIEGVQDLREKNKFTVTREQLDLLREYRQENSSVEGFIAEVLDFEEGATISARELYDNYKEYCVKDGRKFKGNIGFAKEMKAYGKRYMKFSFHDRANGHDVASFEGIKLAEGWGKYSSSSVNVINYLNTK
ncbi:MAG: phage/plasmid primase, P4 family, partial [Candidatus Aenigmarchaeota archaeon]|nr:phage/plasmid primase, P4 family [Candidatus Aenigmarchaeota archaeon]